MRIAWTILAAALISTSALATPEEPKTAKPAEDKVICKGERSLEFGSHRRAKKVCMTESQWKELEKGTQRELQSFKDRTQTHGDAIGR